MFVVVVVVSSVGPERKVRFWRGARVEGISGPVVQVEQVAAAVVPDDQVGQDVAVDVAEDHRGRRVVLRTERDGLGDGARQIVDGEREPALERHAGHADGHVAADLTGEATAGAAPDHEEPEPAVERDEVRRAVAERHADVLRQHAHDDRAERALIANRVPGTERAQAIDLG